MSFKAPVFCLHEKQGGRYGIQVMPKVGSGVQEIIDWANFLLYGIQPPKKEHAIPIPRLIAHEFMQKALNPKRDAVLLLAAPKMQLYEESQNTVRCLIEAFAACGVETVDFYEYNTITERVQGLELPKSDKPQLSIWPASETPGGSAFAGFLDPKMTFETLIQVLATVSREQIMAISEKIDEIMQRTAK